MGVHAVKTTENQSIKVNNPTQKRNTGRQSSNLFVDNRPETIIQKKLQKFANNSPNNHISAQLYSISNSTIQKQEIEEEELLQGKFEITQKQELEEELLQGKFETVQKVEEEELLQGKFEPIQKIENKTGLPDNLKSGIENLSGHSMDDVKVHYNSDEPAKLQAHAFAQGSNIHVGSRQEEHLPHEAWHVAQQKQGRVKPTMQLKGNVNVNDDIELEKEADVMGAKAITSGQNNFTQQLKKKDNVAGKAGFGSTHLLKQNKLLIQAVLIDKEKAGLNASLVGKYHTAEENGDSKSITSMKVTDHEEAIEYYKQAKRLRKSAGKLHVDQDGGHITAIATLNDKISARRAKIRDLKPKEARPKRRISSSQERGKPDHSVVIGTSDQASWITGVSAWQPR